MGDGIWSTFGAVRIVVGHLIVCPSTKVVIHVFDLNVSVFAFSRLLKFAAAVPGRKSE
jgi:hypothetical protein